VDRGDSLPGMMEVRTCALVRPSITVGQGGMEPGKSGMFGYVAVQQEAIVKGRMTPISMRKVIRKFRLNMP
jgi:hypothetical protein